MHGSIPARATNYKYNLMTTEVNKYIHLSTGITVQHTYTKAGWHITTYRTPELVERQPVHHVTYISIITIIIIPHLLMAIAQGSIKPILYAPWPVYLILAITIATYITKCLIFNSKYHDK